MSLSEREKQNKNIHLMQRHHKVCPHRLYNWIWTYRLVVWIACIFGIDCCAQTSLELIGLLVGIGSTTASRQVRHTLCLLETEFLPDTRKHVAPCFKPMLQTKLQLAVQWQTTNKQTRKQQHYKVTLTSALPSAQAMQRHYTWGPVYSAQRTA